MAPPDMPRWSTETILQVLAGQGITTVSTRDFQRLFRYSPATTLAKLRSLAGEGVLRRFLHGWYVVRGPAEAEVLGDPMFLATRLVEPSYVAYGSALRFHGWTKRAPPVTLVASPRRSHLRSAGGHPVRVVQVPAFRFYGFRTVRRGSLEFAVADPEKAVVDGFHHPHYFGGIRPVIAALERAGDSLDLGRLEAYAVRMDSESLCSRLGYVLDTLGMEPRLLPRHASQSGVKLDSRGPREGPRDSRWWVIDNL